MKKWIAGLAVLAAASIPAIGIGEEVCLDDVTGSHDCVRATSDGNNGGTIEIDGDDDTTRSDGYSDGYIAVSGNADGTLKVYCEDEGGYNYGDSDETNGDNQECQDAAP